MSNKTRGSILNICIHWQFVKPGALNAKLKVIQCPSDMKDMLEKCDEESHLANDVNNKISRSSLLSLLETLLSKEEHFKTDQHTCSLEPDQFLSKTVLCATTSPDANIKHDGPNKSSSNKLNKEMQAIRSEADWKKATQAAEETFEDNTKTSTRKKRLSQSFSTAVLTSLHLQLSAKSKF